jgi:hypothetical protein
LDNYGHRKSPHAYRVLGGLFLPVFPGCISAPRHGGESPGISVQVTGELHAQTALHQKRGPAFPPYTFARSFMDVLGNSNDVHVFTERCAKHLLILQPEAKEHKGE